MSTFKARIFTPDKLIFEGEIEALHIPTNRGNLTIYSQYADYLTLIVPGTMRIVINKEQNIYFISDGLLKVEDGMAYVMGEAIEAQDEIDLERALAARERAEKRLKEKSTETDLRRAEAALMRAIERIKVSNKR